MQLKLLRVFLGLSAVTWGAAIIGTFMSWDAAVATMEAFGAAPIVHD